MLPKTSETPATTYLSEAEEPGPGLPSNLEAIGFFSTFYWVLDLESVCLESDCKLTRINSKIIQN